MRVLIQRISEAQDLPLPKYVTEDAAGLDLYAALAVPLCLEPGERSLVSTGVRIALPPGYEGQVRPRSGLALKYGIGMVNAPGTLDADYRGVVSVLLINLGQEAVVIQRGDRIAQLVVAPVTRVEWEEASDEGLPPTKRGVEGFGSTGLALATGGERG